MMSDPLGPAVRRWPFAAYALAVALGVAVVSDFGVIAGKVPLPADLLAWFPAWEGVKLPVRPPDARFAEEGDLITLMYPWRTYLGESLRNGHLPYWNPQIMMGSPFLANPISAVFYAPNWLFAILPAHRAWSVQFFVRTALAVFFAAMLARVIGASRTGALLSGVVFARSGFMTAWQGWPQADCLLWAPLIMLCFFAIRRRPTARRGALLGLALTFPILAGHPEVGLYVLAVGSGFGAVMLVSAWRRGRPARWTARFAGSVLLGFALAGGICAVQLVPTAQWLPRITRTLARRWGPLPRGDIVSLVSRDARADPNSAGIHVPEECSYPSVAVLLLAPLALFHQRRGLAAYFTLAAVFAVEVAFGFPPFSPIFRAIPRLQGLPGSRLLGVFDLSVAMLGGLGLTVLQQHRRYRSRRLGIFAVLAAASIGLATLALELHRRLRAPGRNPRGEWTEFVVLALLALALISVGLLWPKRGAGLAAILAIVAVVDLVAFSRGHVPMVAAKAVFPWSPLFDFLRTQTPAGERVLFLRGTATANAEMLYGLDTPGGYPQVLKPTARLLAPLNGGSEADEPLKPFDGGRILQSDPRLLDRLCVRFLAANTYTESPETLARLAERFPLRLQGYALRLFENRSALPLVSLVPDGRGGESAGSAFDVRREVNLVSGRIQSERPGVWRIAQTYYPGWRGFLDGVETAVRRSDDDFCEMIVPSGRHEFRLEFRPSHFGLAASVSGLSVLSVLALMLPSRPRSARPSATSNVRSRRPSPQPGRAARAGGSRTRTLRQP